MNRIKTHLYGQFHRPHGPLGHLAGRIMSRRSSNVERSRWTVDLLSLAPDARVLEVGYGPGIGIQAALEAAPRGRVVGIDHSRAMQAMATRRNRDETRGPDRLKLLVGEARNPPADLGTFDAIFSCNVWLFWDNPEATTATLAELLAPGGQLAVTHQPRHTGAERADTDAAADRIEHQLRRARLIDVRRHLLDLEPVPVVCVIGRAAAASEPDVEREGDSHR